MPIIIGGGGSSGGGSVNWSSITGKPAIATTVGDPGSDTNLVSEQAVREALALVGGGSGDLNGLSDVIITTPADGESLVYNGTEFVNASVSYDDLADVPSTFAPSSHSHALADLTDFNITTPADGSFLQYDTATSKWIDTVPDLSAFADVAEFTATTNDFLVGSGANEFATQQPDAVLTILGIKNTAVAFNDPAPANGEVIICDYMPFAGTITNLVQKTSSGTVNATIKINGTNVTGLVTQGASSTRATSTATAANTFTAGAVISIEFASGSTPVNYSGTLRMTRNA